MAYLRTYDELTWFERTVFRTNNAMRAIRSAVVILIVK